MIEVFAPWAIIDVSTPVPIECTDVFITILVCMSQETANDTVISS